MADFKDVIIRLQENKNDNREALKEQTQELSTAFTSAIKSQNRSFGQSLSLQQGKSTKSLESIAESLAGLTTALGVAPKVEAAQTAELEEGSEQEVSSLGSVYDVLLSIDTNFKEYFSYNKQRDAEAERKATLGEKAKAGTKAVAGAAAEGGKKGFGALLGAGALAGAALKGVSGIATMGVAISAFFGGLVIGNEALEFAANRGYGDFDFGAIKKSAKGFSEIVGELSTEAMIALGGIIAAGSFASKGGMGGATGMAMGVAAMGLGISAFFGGLLFGDTILEGVSILTGGADFSGFKKVIAGFDSVVTDMSVQSRIVIGALLAAGAATSITGKSKATSTAYGVAAMGLGISGFFAGLLAGDLLLDVGASVLGGDLNLGSLKTVVAGFADIVDSLDTKTMTALGAIFGLSFLTSYTTKAKATEVAFGMAAIGAGIGGFFVGLGLGDAALSFLGTDFTGIGEAVKNFGEAISGLDEQALIALGGLLGAGGVIGMLGKAGGAANVAAGMTAVGAGIAGFLIALAGADFIAKMTGDGSNVAALVKNFGDAISSLDKTALIALGGLLGAGAVFGMVPGAAQGAAIGMTVIGAGIAGFFLAFEGLAKFGELFGLDGSTTKKLLGNMSDGLKTLDGLDGGNLLKVGGALLELGPAIAMLLGAEGLGKVASFVTDTLKGAWNWLTGKDDEGKKEETIIDQLVELIKPVEELNAVDLDRFLDTTNALTQFLQNDYMKGGDEFEYFVNKLMTNVPKLESAIFGGGDIMGLAYNEDSYIQASKNIRVLREALNANLDENTDTRFGGNMERGNNASVITSNSAAYQTNNNSTYAVATSSTNKDRTAQMYNNVNGSFYDTVGADF